MPELLLPGLTAALYAILAFGANSTARRSTAENQPTLAIHGLTAAAIAIHAVLTYGFLYQPGGIDLRFTNTLSLTALVTVMIFWASSWKTRLDGFGMVVMPIAGICALLPTLPLGSAHPISLSPALLSHILLSIIAYSLLTVASLQALFMTFIDRQIRSKPPGHQIGEMPPLQQLETLLFRFILAGLIMLTASLVSGWLYLDDLFAQHVVHKTVLSLLAWLVYATLLLGHNRFGWRGRTAVRLCLAAFGLLVLGYIGSKFVLEIILQR